MNVMFCDIQMGKKLLMVRESHISSQNLSLIDILFLGWFRRRLEASGINTSTIHGFSVDLDSVVKEVCFSFIPFFFSFLNDFLFSL